MKSLVLLPAVDVANGRAVRLEQGNPANESFSEDPLIAAKLWQSTGASWIHLVDLDAAFGKGENRIQLAQVIANLQTKVELSGGIKDEESLRVAVATGCNRIVLSSASLLDLEWTKSVIAEFGDLIAVGLDVKGETVSARGGPQEIGNLWEILAELEQAGCARYVVTDVTKDGMLQGPNLELLRAVCAKTQMPVIASGGISNLGDIEALRTLVSVGVEGAIVGKALYAKAFTLEEAISVAGTQDA